MAISKINKRASGVLMPIFSLPSDSFNGTFGKYAYEFVDFLASSKQSYWQFLPMVDKCVLTNSPYSAISSVAGDTRFIDTDIMYEENLLNNLEFKQIKYFEKVERSLKMSALLRKHQILQNSFTRIKNNLPKDFIQFCTDEKEWLDDYALYSSMKNQCLLPFYDWPEVLKFRDKLAMKEYTELYTDDINFYKYLQYLFFKQWFALKKYANSKGIKMIGDIPYFMNHDTPEAWANPKNYYFDKNLNIDKYSCYPPAKGETKIKIYGFPLYNWEYFKQTNYKYLKDKINYAKRMYDVIRFDHFIGYDTIFFSKKDAKLVSEGKWEKSHIDVFIKVLKDTCKDIPVIIESSDCFSKHCNDVIAKNELTKILCVQDMFPENILIEALPKCVSIKNNVLCLGNHDTNTLLGWINTASKPQINSALKIYNAESKKNLANKMLYWLAGSNANTVIYQAQDLLLLDENFRTNTPNSYDNCFEWRFSKEQFDQLDSNFLAELTINSNRTK